MAALLPLLIAAPLLAAGLLIVVPGGRVWRRSVSMVTVAAVVAGSLYLIPLVAGGTPVAHAVGGWAPGISIVVVADIFSALMLVVTGGLTLVGLWFAAVTGQDDRRHFSALALILVAGVYGALLTADLFNLFVFVEVMLLPSYALIIVSAPGRGRVSKVSASRIYVTVNLLTSTLLLAGIGLIYAVAGTVNMAQLAGLANRDPAVAAAAAVALLALSVKASVAPVHGWLSRTYPYMSSSVTMIFSGLHTKVAAYGIYRIYAVLFDGDQRFLWIGVALFSLTMLMGVWGAVGEYDSRAILSFHMVSQLGYILLGVALFTPLGLTAGIFYLLHHMIVKASLFASIGAVEHAYGRHQIGRVTGLVRREPVTAAVFFVAALSLAGIPPMSGFVAKLTLVVAAWEAGHVLAMVVAVVVSLFTAQSMMKIWGKTFLGDHKDTDPEILAEAGRSGSRISPALIGPAAVLALATVVLGVGAQILLPLTEQAAAGLLDTSAYVKAVLAS